MQNMAFENAIMLPLHITPFFNGAIFPSIILFFLFTSHLILSFLLHSKLNFNETNAHTKHKIGSCKTSPTKSSLSTPIFVSFPHSSHLAIFHSRTSQFPILVDSTLLVVGDHIVVSTTRTSMFPLLAPHTTTPFLLSISSSEISYNSSLQVEITKSPKIGTSFATLIGKQQSVEHL